MNHKNDNTYHALYQISRRASFATPPMRVLNDTRMGVATRLVLVWALVQTNAEQHQGSDIAAALGISPSEWPGVHDELERGGWLRPAPSDSTAAWALTDAPLFERTTTRPASTDDAATNAPIIPVGDACNRFIEIGFRSAQVVQTAFRQKVHNWRAQGVTEAELDKAIALTHERLPAGERPRSPHFYDRAVGEVIAARAGASSHPTGSSGDNHEQSSVTRVMADIGDNLERTGREPERTQADRDRERRSFGFCREDLAAGNG